MTVELSTRPAVPVPSAPRRPQPGRRLLRLFALDSRRPFRDLSVGFVAGAIGVALNIGIYAAAGWYHVQSVQFDAGALLIDGLLMMFVFKGAFEEILFRGIVFRGIERVSGTVVALIVASLGFGLMHLMNAGATLLNALGTAVAGGVMLSAAYLLTRNLWLAIGIHWAADFWQGAFFGVAPTGDTFSHPLLHSTLNGPTVWTGGDYGGGIVGLAIGCSAAAVMLVIAKRRGHFRPFPFGTGRAAHDPKAPTMTITMHRPPPTTTPSRPSARGYWFGSVLLVGALVVGVAWALSGWHGYQQHLRGLHRASAPGPVTAQLHAGDRQVIYYEGPRGSAPFAPTDISIYDPTGAQLSPHLYTYDARYDVPDQPGRVGSAIASFTPPVPGRYTIRTSTPQSGAVLAVGQDVASSAVPGLIGGLVVIFAGVAGGTVAIAITAVRRRGVRAAVRP